MTTILFVHGTGVREIADSSTVRTVTARVAERLPGVRVEAVDWGAAFGVEVSLALRTLIGIADPEERGRSVEIDPAEAELRLGVTLESHPLHELRAVAEARAQAGARRPTEAAEDLRWAVRHAVIEIDLAAVLPGGPAEWAESFTAAARDVAHSAEFEAAADVLAATADHDVIARAVVGAFGQALAGRADGAGPWPTEWRDLLVAAVRDACGGRAAGGGRVSGALKSSLMYASWPLQNLLRGGTLGGSVPAIGDILYYQAHGEVLRAYLAARIARIQGPVVVLAHSLGGIASFETLTQARSATEPDHPRHLLPGVRALITVGSQIGYFGALGALATQPAQGGPPTHPSIPWINVWNARDWLSFRAEPVFAEAVRDVEVRARRPFPQAHSAYWRCDALYAEIARVVGGDR
ncbi:hypothetical protein [Embleya scabrispora]|uniref:hypothetical protein n=1 Tax=Embleya scabrispora TaxID=159449 RepID=UPI000365BCB1|nr:hypothetical protein [Embleya scabrispora]MYS83786.1 hypothetical protein [Streptomyces sp. SID5474]